MTASNASSDRAASQPGKPMRGFFITSVGTGIGKTLVTAILGYQLKRGGANARVLKPVVSGFEPDDPASDPALLLRSLGQIATPDAIAAIAPWRFAAPISPHLAARREHRIVKIDDIVAFCHEQMNAADFITLIEGAGGVMAPIDEQHTCLDLIARLECPVIIVTGSYLGAISHTLTALKVLSAVGAEIRGIVVSETADGVGLNDTAESLRQFAAESIPVYCLPRLAGIDEDQWREAPSLLSLCMDSVEFRQSGSSIRATHATRPGSS